MFFCKFWLQRVFIKVRIYRIVYIDNFVYIVANILQRFLGKFVNCLLKYF